MVANRRIAASADARTRACRSAPCSDRCVATVQSTRSALDETHARPSSTSSATSALTRATAPARETRAGARGTVGLRATDVVLEIGCGIGRVGGELARRVGDWIGSTCHRRCSAMPANGSPRSPTCGSSRPRGSTCGRSSADRSTSSTAPSSSCTWTSGIATATCRRRSAAQAGGRIYVDNFNLLSDEGWAASRRTLPSRDGSAPDAHLEGLDTAGARALPRPGGVQRHRGRTARAVRAGTRGAGRRRVAARRRSLSPLPPS